jgi:thiamine monophosphate kinase
MTTRKADPRLSSLGEWGLLRRILPPLNRIHPRRFRVPPGDDAAVMADPRSTTLSIDGLTEGTHFETSWAPAVRSLLGVSLGRALGWKLLGSALSDLAAMGAVSQRWAMIYLGAPPQVRASFLLDFHQGLLEPEGTRPEPLT